MARRRDPIERAADDSTDLYDVSTWEPRSFVDRLAYRLYGTINVGLRSIIIVAAALITTLLLASPAVVVLDEPITSVFFALSVVPALVLAAYIWYADITSQEPLGLLVATFGLAVLFAAFAAVFNAAGSALLQPIPFVGTILFFFLIVGPVEEGVKLLAVRVLAYRSDSFDAVIDGAVYGAVAGLGFAAIENTLYISQVVTAASTATGVTTAATGIATVRALVGPGHVIFSAIAGYYLGLAKFNPQYAGPLVVKGLLVASIFHATYNSTVQWVPGLITATYPVSDGAAFVGYVVAFDLMAGYYLYRKIKRYRGTYRTIRSDLDEEPVSELTEFEPSQR